MLFLLPDWEPVAYPFYGLIFIWNDYRREEEVYIIFLFLVTIAAALCVARNSGGVLTAGTITSGTAIATGTAAWWRLYESDAATALIDGSVGTGVNYNLVMNSAAIVTGATVAVSAMTVTITE